LLSDVHLETAPQPEREAAVRSALEAHSGVDVVFLGDLFEFATAPKDGDAALTALLGANATFCDAVRAHAATGASIHWVAGNHDGAIAGLEASARRLLGINITVWPWFMRVGAVHLEHGHLFDRDNAPLHPLATWDARDEPLGVVLMRKIVVELGARQWAHAHQTTPAQALRQAASWFGWALPARFAQGIGALACVSLDAVAGRWGRVRRAEAEGAALLDAYAARHRVSPDALGHLLSRRARPTHAHFWLVFRRLYLDWVFALAAAIFGGGVGLATGGVWPWAATLMGGGYALREGLMRRESRYPPPLDALREGALRIAAATRAVRVVFGHTHVEEDCGSYTNLGSFGYRGQRGRAYGLVTEDGDFTRCYLP
jgi:predicted phosphodiesterase